MGDNSELLRRALRILMDKCPRLVATCYWAGTSAIALEELSHRQSFDLDFQVIEPSILVIEPSIFRATV